VSWIGGTPSGGGPGALRFAQTRGRIGNSPGQGVAYPSPFFDVAHTWLPATVKQLFKICRFYFLTNPLINATVTKLSEYPITDLVIEHQDPQVVARWKEFLYDVLNIRAFQLETGLDYHVFGNSFPSVVFPFWKMLRCRQCNHEDKASALRPHWRFVSNEFRLTCPRCGFAGDAAVRDLYLRSPNGIRLMRWSPENIDTLYTEVGGGKSTYFYTPPKHTQNDITIGRKEVLEETPQLFLQAQKEQKAIVFAPDAVFHFKRPNLAESVDRAWGTPLLLPVLKDTFYLQIMKKAQEAILLEHILPLRVLFPQPGSGAADPFTSSNLSVWKEHVSAEIVRWRLDPSYIPIMPLPIGNQTIGGDGKALLMTGEIREHSEGILAGMGVPRELVFGGLSWSGSNVSLRMLENMFLRYMGRQLDMIRWIIREVAAFMGWPIVRVRFKPFKMADDIQRKAYNLQLFQLGLLDEATILEDSDFSPENTRNAILNGLPLRQEIKKQIAVGDAIVAGEASLIAARYQGRAQLALMEASQAGVAAGVPGGEETQAPGGSPDGQGPLPGGGGLPGALAGAASPLQASQAGQVGVDMNAFAGMQAQVLGGMDPAEQQRAIATMQATSPDLAKLVLKQLGTGAGKAGPAAPSTGGVDMRPQPEQRAPRRDTPSI